MNNFENPHYYDHRFTDNILVLGQTGCGKTTFGRKIWEKNKMFRDLDSVNWVPKRTLDKITENHIRFCFNYTKVNFHYPDNISDFNSLIENFHSENTNIVDDNSYKIFGEKKIE